MQDPVAAGEMRRRDEPAGERDFRDRQVGQTQQCPRVLEPSRTSKRGRRGHEFSAEQSRQVPHRQADASREFALAQRTRRLGGQKAPRLRHGAMPPRVRCGRIALRLRTRADGFVQAVLDRKSVV